MFNALISHKGQTAILNLPMDRFSLQYELAQIGLRKRFADIPISDEEEQDVQVKLYADSDMGNSLAVLFKPSHSLEDANLCAHMVENARPELREEIEHRLRSISLPKGNYGGHQSHDGRAYRRYRQLLLSPQISDERYGIRRLVRGG